MLQLLQDALLVLLLIFQSDDLLDVITAFELAAHRFDLFLVKGDLHLRLLQFVLFLDDVGLLLHLGVLGLFLDAGLLDVLLELFRQVAQLVTQALVLLSEFLHDVVVLFAGGQRGLRVRSFHFPATGCFIYLINHKAPTQVVRQSVCLSVMGEDDRVGFGRGGQVLLPNFDRLVTLGRDEARRGLIEQKRKDRTFGL